ncbi:MAG: F0F1 ATP synthase subunit epsilon, partial [Betaproteobacteria bacterium AqS2]|nr:F0F1 ATP synthase subunit epsilon [Betaproteobacteria bacterium AqS2]
MAATIKVEVVSAERSLYSGVAEMVVAPAAMGDVGILPRHAPLLTGLRPGILKLVSGEDEELMYVAGGIMEVQPDMVTVLADVAERGEDLDEERVEAARKEAEEMLADRSGDIDYAKAQAELAKAVAQLELLRKL